MASTRNDGHSAKLGVIRVTTDDRDMHLMTNARNTRSTTAARNSYIAEFRNIY